MTSPSLSADPAARIAIPLPQDGQGMFRLPLTTPSREALLDAMEARLADGQGFSVATLNLDHVVKLRQSPEFRAAYASHSHVVADGNPIVWLAGLSGTPVELVPGSELVEPVAEMARRRGWPIGFFGSRAEVLEAAAEELERRYPGLEVAGRIAPPLGFDPEGDAAAAHIAAFAESPVRIWFLALGAPKQEIFAARAAARLPHLGFLSVGAGVDFIAGAQVRAPKLVRRLKAEWLWRMASAPGRLGPRYARCIGVLPGLTRAALAQRRGGGAGS